jgi:Ca-activated chloride channel family protein
MIEWGNIAFERAWLLWGILPWVLLAIWYFTKASSNAAIASNHIGNFQIVRSPRQWLYLFSRALPWLSGLALIVALAGPYYQFSEEEQFGEGIDIFLSMDISASMLAKDFEPNRLEVAKNVAASFVAKRPFDRIGIAAFAGEAYTLAPLTTDKSILQQFIQQLKVGYLKDGTAIGMGLATGVNRLEESESASKVIILLTDGVNNSGYIAPRTAMDIAKQKDIKVYTIGVGSKGQAPVPYARRNNRYAYRMAKVNIDESLLKEIAKATGGKYFRAQNAEELEAIYEEIDALEKSEVQIEVFSRRQPAFQVLTWISLGSLFLFLLVNYFILKIWP